MDRAEETAGLVQSRGHFWSFSVKKVAAPTTVWRELAEDSLPPSLTASLPGHIPDCRPLHPGCHHLLCSHGHPAHLFSDLHGQGKLPTWGSKTMAACWTPGPCNLNTLAPGKQDQDASHKLIQTFFFFFLLYLFILFLWPYWVFLAAHGIFRCSSRTLQLLPMGLVAPRHVGS